ncbi:hypothetical protein DSECCO2_519850 [anaerobic digester metagenome]
MAGDVTVRNAHGYPYGSFVVYRAGAAPFVLYQLRRPLADHLKDPHFIGIGDREGFSRTVVTIFGNQFAHDADGFTCGFCPLEGDIHQAAVINDSGRINQFRQSAISGFTDGHLMLVYITDNGPGMLCLFYLPEVFPGIPFIDIEHGSFGIICCRSEIQFSVKHM